MIHNDPYGNRSQCMFLVMQCLSELTGSNTKQEVLSHIRQMGYYQITKHDLPSYPGQSESRYHTLLAWARKDCVVSDLILNNERDAWALSLKGREVIKKFRELCQSQVFDVRRCYLWTENFKKTMDSQYQPSSLDAPRPEAEFDGLLKALGLE